MRFVQDIGIRTTILKRSRRGTDLFWLPKSHEQSGFRHSVASVFLDFELLLQHDPAQSVKVIQTSLILQSGMRHTSQSDQSKHPTQQLSLPIFQSSPFEAVDQNQVAPTTTLPSASGNPKTPIVTLVCPSFLDPALTISGVVALSSVSKWPSEGPDKEGLCLAVAMDVSSALEWGLGGEWKVRMAVERGALRVGWRALWGSKQRIFGFMLRGRVRSVVRNSDDTSFVWLHGQRCLCWCSLEQSKMVSIEGLIGLLLAWLPSALAENVAFLGRSFITKSQFVNLLIAL